ncbi:transmembrane protein, putative (macronuclear) [Tetrahymena thermophila SB210]|uniref:Transmembrane protein, putative n=1 Tax=Tetrahymena thermophila (strain SB210) TaxID=312017 RepID=W7XK96_TETTS|nr:transmembrane protein, putative [Tetrahymena thermophila SB210]EWS76311.1 transmembrane protein, putative [Tetrahymena thermophila SB210]|eukprot:XP_012651095.1 transmembrane protein, putative [Tetrahymena thermophila SB210]
MCKQMHSNNNHQQIFTLKKVCLMKKIAKSCIKSNKVLKYMKINIKITNNLVFFLLKDHIVHTKAILISYQSQGFQVFMNQRLYNIPRINDLNLFSILIYFSSSKTKRGKLIISYKANLQIEIDKQKERNMDKEIDKQIDKQTNKQINSLKRYLFRQQLFYLQTLKNQQTKNKVNTYICIQIKLKMQKEKVKQCVYKKQKVIQGLFIQLTKQLTNLKNFDKVIKLLYYKIIYLNYQILYNHQSKLINFTECLNSFYNVIKVINKASNYIILYNSILYLFIVLHQVLMFYLLSIFMQNIFKNLIKICLKL